MSKCKICGKDALKSQRSGLCSKHHAQYSRQRESEGRTLKQFIEFMTMPVKIDGRKHTKITVDNAPEQKLFWQARKEQEAAIRQQRENELRARELVQKTEADKATRLILSAILKDLEALTDIFPPILEHKSAGEIRPIIVKQTDLTFAKIRETLDGLRE